MVAAAGFWAWWNQYGNVPLDVCVRRAKDAGIGVIVKSGYINEQRAFANAGVPWATERYVYPANPPNEAERLAGDIDRGARFAVINAEVEWETKSRSPMEALVRRFRALQPTAELYASTDTRGDRTRLPYQQVLGENIAGWMPMVYPKAFFPGRADMVQRAFRASLDGKEFRGKPVLPTIQTYQGIGAVAVSAQLEEIRRRALDGCQAYTIAHATDAEWAAFIAGKDYEEEEDMGMTPAEVAEQQSVDGFQNQVLVKHQLVNNFQNAIMVELRKEQPDPKVIERLELHILHEHSQIAELAREGTAKALAEAAAGLRREEESDG